MKQVLILILFVLFSCNRKPKNISTNQESLNKYRKEEQEVCEYDMINGCEKKVYSRIFQNNGRDWIEWKKNYSRSENQTCDFSAYIIYLRKVESGILKEETQYIAGCDECVSDSCGTWNFYNESGGEN